MKEFNIETKTCTKCKIEKSLSEFNKGNDTGALTYWCKQCYKQYQKQYKKNNNKRLIKYRKNNIKQRAKYSRQYYIANYKRLKEYREKNKKQIITCRKNNIKHKAKYSKQYNNNYVLFTSYSMQLKQFEKIRCCPKNKKLLEVKCAYCGKWILPTNLQVRNRIQVFNGTISGEQRFYCSENCKQACPIFNQKKWPKDFKQATSREVVPLLRQLVLERDNWTCQKCGTTTEMAQLHVHHIIPYAQNKMQANDPDSCITLCKKCHEKVHQQDGCKYSDLKCKN